MMRMSDLMSESGVLVLCASSCSRAYLSLVFGVWQGCQVFLGETAQRVLRVSHSCTASHCHTQNTAIHCNTLQEHTTTHCNRGSASLESLLAKRVEGDVWRGGTAQRRRRASRETLVLARAPKVSRIFDVRPGPSRSSRQDKRLF